MVRARTLFLVSCLAFPLGSAGCATVVEVKGVVTRAFPSTWFGGTAPSRPSEDPALAATPSRGAVAEGLPANVQRGAPQPTAVALVVGIEKYRELSSPSGARSDAQRMGHVFGNTFGIPEVNVRVITDDRATKSDIEKSLDWATAVVKPGGRIYFYFSGHGAPDPTTGTPYLVPYDGDPAYLDRTSVKLEAVSAALAASPAREVLLVADACFSGQGERSVLAKGARPIVLAKRSTEKTPSKVAVLSASGAAETSGPSPSGNGGLFTEMFVEGLATGRADADGDGQISLTELTEYVAPRVARSAKRDGREQHPQVNVGGNLAADTFMLAWGLGAPR